MVWPTRIVFVFLCIGLGVGLARLLPSIQGGNATAAGCNISLLLDTAPPYPFVKPLLGVVTSKPCFDAQYATLRTEVSKVAAEQPAGAVTRYGYFFRDLSDSSWTGIDENDAYDPGSMLKIVVALATYKQEEVVPGFTSSRLLYTQNLAQMNAALQFAPPVALQVGHSYAVPYLLQEMLSDSDNASKDLLLASMDPQIISKVYSDLAIPSPNSNNSAGYTISPLQFSRFLRILYYGLYDLNWSDSNLLLQTLTQSTYTTGLVAGVPAGVSVAHKFGEHIKGVNGKATDVELSDCGIVYHKKHPYLICVMTQGSDEDVLAKFIADVSRATYGWVDTHVR